MSQSINSLPYYNAEHTRLIPKTEELWAANQNRARKTLMLRQPVTIEHEKPSLPSANQNGVLRHPSRQPFRFEHPRALGKGGGPFWDLGSSRLAIAYFNTWGPPPPSDLLTLLLLSTFLLMNN